MFLSSLLILTSNMNSISDRKNFFPTKFPCNIVLMVDKSSFKFTIYCIKNYNIYNITSAEWLLQFLRALAEKPQNTAKHTQIDFFVQYCHLSVKFVIFGQSFPSSLVDVCPFGR